MSKKVTLGEQLVASLASIRGASHQSLALGDDFPLPRLMYVGDGRTLQITKAIDHLIWALADELKAERPSLAKAVSRTEFGSLVRTACGPILVELDLSQDFVEAGEELVRGVEKAVDEQIAGFPRREYAFGVTLFAAPGIAAFSIGPVTFEEWHVWLERKKAEGELSAVTERRLRKAWSGARLTKRKPGGAASQEQQILRAMARAPYVGSIWIEGFAPRAGLDAAANAVRLAITIVALLWPTPSRALEGMRLRFDPKHHSERAVTFVPGRFVIGGSRLRGTPFGPTISPADWAATRTRAASIITAAGQAIDLLVNPDETPPRFEVMRALLQSIQWFYAGCRELSDPIAIVHFGASLDALASGAGQRGIVELFEARFGLAHSDPLFLDGATVETTIKDLYGEGRSQLVHGISKRIGHDWVERRSQIENLAVHALIACLEFTAADQTVVKAKHLRRKTRRSMTAVN